MPPSLLVDDSGSVDDEVEAVDVEAVGRGSEQVPHEGGAAIWPLLTRLIMMGSDNITLNMVIVSRIRRIRSKYDNARSSCCSSYSLINSNWTTLKYFFVAT